MDTVKNKIPHSFFIRFLLDLWNGSDPCEGFTLADDGQASTTGFTNQLNVPVLVTSGFNDKKRTQSGLSRRVTTQYIVSLCKVVASDIRC